MGTRVASTPLGGVRTTVATLSIAVAAFAFQQTAITPAIPIIEHELGASPAWSAWLLSGYLLASAVSTPVLGKLADRFGKRRLAPELAGRLLAGSVGAPLAPSLVALVAARLVQGRRRRRVPARAGDLGRRAVAGRQAGCEGRTASTAAWQRAMSAPGTPRPQRRRRPPPRPGPVTTRS
jgi:hypothetical protein